MTERKKTGPKPTNNPKAFQTTSLRIYRADAERLEWCRVELCTKETEATNTDVWRAALLALERELKAKRKAAREAKAAQRQELH